MILKAAWVVPVTAPPIRDGFVEVREGRIANVGPASDHSFADREIVDLGASVLLPGLVNPHTHLELTCYHGMIAPAPLWSWLESLIRLRAAKGQLEREADAVVDGAWRSLRYGVTCVGDISRRNIAWAHLKTIPLRKVCFVEVLSAAQDPPRDIVELRCALDKIEEDELLTAGVSPHSPYTVPPDQIREAVLLAAERGRPWCAHWAETLEEVAFLEGRSSDPPPLLTKAVELAGVPSPRTSPMAYLADCAGGCPSGTLAHCNYLDDADIGRLAAAGHVVVYCPRAHHFFGHRSHAFQRMRAAGVTVALGTDSAASNTDLDLLSEVRFIAENVPDPPPPADLLRMVTLDAAAALGLRDEIGSLEVPKAADLAAFACPPETADPLATLVRKRTALRGVWVAGRRVSFGD